MECIQEFPEHYKVILDRLNEQREQDQFTDITLIVDGMYRPENQLVFRILKVVLGMLFNFSWSGVRLGCEQILSSVPLCKLLAKFHCSD